jgi:hypothetical protein
MYRLIILCLGKRENWVFSSRVTRSGLARVDDHKPRYFLLWDIICLVARWGEDGDSPPSYSEAFRASVRAQNLPTLYVPSLLPTSHVNRDTYLIYICICNQRPRFILHTLSRVPLHLSTRPSTPHYCPS